MRSFGLSAEGVLSAVDEPESMEKDMVCPQMGEKGTTLFNYWMIACVHRQKTGGGCSTLSCQRGFQVFAMLTGEWRGKRSYTLRQSKDKVCRCGAKSLHEDLLKKWVLQVPICHDCLKAKRKRQRRARAARAYQQKGKR